MMIIIITIISAQPTMNLIIKTAAKIAEELSQPREKSDAKQEGIRHTKARLGEVLKNKWKNNMGSTLEI